MTIDETFLEGLLEKATESERRRANYDMRTSQDDGSQRMLNALLPGTQVPVHRHPGTTETVVVLSGSLTEVLYDEDGNETARYVLCPARGKFGMQIPKGAWHTVIVDEPCIIFEAKDGAYKPTRIEDVMDRNAILKRRLEEFIEMERRSCSMDLITPEYICRMWGGKVSLNDIELVMLLIEK